MTWELVESYKNKNAFLNTYFYVHPAYNSQAMHF